MSAAIAAAGVAVVGGAIIANQNRKAAEGAANAQKKSTNAATDVERERLQQEAAQYQEQMQEYRRKQAMAEKQMQQAMVQLAPYIQGGQGALYEMMALTGMAAPQGAQMPTSQQPVIGGLRGIGIPAQPTQTTPGRMGILQNVRGTMATPTPMTGGQSPGQQLFEKELRKGGRSLSSKAWQTVSPDANDRAKVAHAWQRANELMPLASDQEKHAAAVAALDAEILPQQQQALINEARTQVPTVESAISPYAGMTGEQAQRTAIERVAQNPLLQELMAQGETGILQNAAATGGLRGGRTQAALAQFRPAMLQQEIDKLYGRLQGISGMGQQSILSAPTTQIGAAPTMSYQSQIPGLLTQAGAAQAGGILSQANQQNQLLQNVGQAVGWGLEKYSQGGFFGGGGGGITTTPTYAGLGIGNPGNY